jgi:hypothetical protein
MDNRLPPVEPPFLLDASLRFSEGLGASDAQQHKHGELEFHHFIILPLEDK